MDNSIFQKIFDLLQGVLPNTWDNLVFYASYSKGSYSMKFYVRNGDTEYLDCFQLPNINRIQIVRLFMSIDKILSPERAMEEETKKWSVMTMRVDSNGNMKSDFDYTDISENFISYEREWKEKYLI